MDLLRLLLDVSFLIYKPKITGRTKIKHLCISQSRYNFSAYAPIFMHILDHQFIITKIKIIIFILNSICYIFILIFGITFA